jgi:hypothetical protein
MALRVVNATGNWSNSAIWEGGVLPLIGDDVIINAANSAATVTLNTNIAVGSIANYETVKWSNTSISLTSKFDNHGSLDISTGTKYISGVLNTYGVVNQVDYYYLNYHGNQYTFIYLNNSSQIVNKSDATYNMTAGNISRNVPSDYQGAEAKFVNQGTFNKINASLISSVPWSGVTQEEQPRCSRG